MPRFKLIVAYDGTNYHGFVRQKNAITVQQVLEEAITAIVRQPVQIEGSGRTDAGVHAKGQCCIFDADTSIPVTKLIRGINSKLPRDIVIKKIEIAADDFHPRFDTKNKTYRYQILNSETNDPFICKYAYFYPCPLDIERMQEAADYIIGEHDFKCFCSAHTTVLSTVRTIYDLKVIKKDELIHIDVCGNGFLYNMVRIIAGTLIQVGSNRLSPDQITAIIKSKDRRLAGPTAPPEGLTMLKIKYEEK
ncbi:MAG: truA [Clostridia bacterium]|jgi:tRNA pseudouridine38-40 synthase|nr:truA [Clostridia bacterium]